jgi:hypothetical protein
MEGQAAVSGGTAAAGAGAGGGGGGVVAADLSISGTQSQQAHPIDVAANAPAPDQHRRR